MQLRGGNADKATECDWQSAIMWKANGFMYFRGPSSLAGDSTQHVLRGELLEMLEAWMSFSGQNCKLRVRAKGSSGGEGGRGGGI